MTRNCCRAIGTSLPQPGRETSSLLPPKPGAGKSVHVTLFDVGGSEPKRLVEYDSGLERISALAFSPDGSILAVGDDAEGDRAALGAPVIELRM